jgi:hypothetical protein
MKEFKKIYIFSTAFSPSLGPTQLIYCGLVYGVKRQGREANNSAPIVPSFGMRGVILSLPKSSSGHKGNFILKLLPTCIKKCSHLQAPGK